MIGNARGWIFSAVILLFTVGLIALTGRSPSVSKPTNVKEMLVGMRSAALKTDPRTILPPGTVDADAGTAYREAADWVKVRENKRKIEAFNKANAKTPELAAALDEGVELLVKGGEASRMNLFAKRPGEIVNYENSKPIMEELQMLGNAAVNMAAIYYGKDATGKDPAKGKRYAEAVFHLGRNLYEERQTFEEYRIGHGLLTNATGSAMVKFTHRDSPKIAEMKALADEKLTQFTVLWTAISGIPNENKGVPYPGDVINIALNSPEPMWQTEALLKLGRMRYMVGVKYGDQRGAERILKEMADRPDVKPNVKAAATAGRDLDVINFRRIG